MAVDVAAVGWASRIASLITLPARAHHIEIMIEASPLRVNFIFIVRLTFVPAKHQLTYDDHDTMIDSLLSKLHLSILLT